jgi:hypothetical protein
MGGDNAIVEDVVDVGLSGEAAQGAGVVFRHGGFNGGDAEVLVTPGEMRAYGGDAGFSVAGNGRVAIEDEVAVRGDAAGVDLTSDNLTSDNLGTGEPGKEEREDESSAQDTPADRTCNRGAKGGRMKN